MCGIFGYIGKDNAADTILRGLKRLEYRGYDSWGVAVVSKNGIKVSKKVGAIGDLSELLTLPESHAGIGHTRWATHGGVTYKNAHPHFSTDRSFVLAQNGIVENYQELKKNLIESGFVFKTETDTEIIVKLVEKYLGQVESLLKAVRLAFKELEGRNTIIVLSSKEDRVIAVRNGSPLVIGVGEGEYFLASDTLSFADKTNKAIFVDDMQMVEYKDGRIKIHDLITQRNKRIVIKTLKQKDAEVKKDGYDHFMLKEIFEQRYVLRNAVDYSKKELKSLTDALVKAKTVFTIGAGGAFYAAEQVAYFLRTVAGVKAMGIRPYEMDSYLHFLDKRDVVIAISQSGETADTTEALKILKKKGVKVASAVNMLGSTITRMSNFPFFSRVGSEICVLSTKSGMAQTAFGYLIAKSLIEKHKEAITSINKLEKYLQEKYLTKDIVSLTKKTAKRIGKKNHIFLLGKGVNNSVSSIGALNIKEASYIHAESFAAGELKHGVIALIEKGTPVISFVDSDKDYQYMVGATAEVKARGAYVIGLGTKPNELFDDFISLPTSSGLKVAVIANIIPCQLLAYHLAVLKGLDPDKPRNLAKSVTVK